MPARWNKEPDKFAAEIEAAQKKWNKNTDQAQTYLKEYAQEQIRVLQGQKQEFEQELASKTQRQDEVRTELDKLEAVKQNADRNKNKQAGLKQSVKFLEVWLEINGKKKFGLKRKMRQTLQDLESQYEDFVDKSEDDVKTTDLEEYTRLTKLLEVFNQAIEAQKKWGGKSELAKNLSVLSAKLEDADENTEFNEEEYSRLSLEIQEFKNEQKILRDDIFALNRKKDWRVPKIERQLKPFQEFLSTKGLYNWRKILSV